MNNKVVLVLSDGLRYDTAVQQMGFLYHLVESKLASLYKMIGGKPAHFEKAARIASEFDWRLNRCYDEHGRYGEWFLDIYGRGLSYEIVAAKYHTDVDQVDIKVRQVLRYISGWNRKRLSFYKYNQHRKK